MASKTPDPESQADAFRKWKAANSSETPVTADQMSGGLVAPAVTPNVVERNSAAMSQKATAPQSPHQYGRSGLGDLGELVRGAKYDYDNYLVRPLDTSIRAIGDAGKAAWKYLTTSPSASPSETPTSQPSETASRPVSSLANSPMSEYLSGSGMPQVNPSSPLTAIEQKPEKPSGARTTTYAPDVTARALKQLEGQMGYDAEHGVDPKAMKAKYDYAMSRINEMQGAFRQREESDAARAAGIVQRGSDGQDRTLSVGTDGRVITPYAGQVIDERGRTIGPNGTPLSSQAAAYEANNLKGVPGGKDAKGRDLTVYHTPYGDISTYQDKTPQAPRPSVIEGKPGQQFLEENANRMARQGMIMEGSPNDKINKEINDLIRDGKPFGSKLAELDAAAARPGFNRAPVITDSAPDPNRTIATPANVAATPESIAQYLKDRDAQAALDTKLGNEGKNRYGLPSNYEEFMQGGGVNDVRSQMAENRAVNQANSAQYAAKQALEKATADRPNGDPLRDAQIAVNQAEAAKQMAMANGATKEQIQRNPGMVSRYLTNPNGMNALGSTEKINQLAMEHLRGADMRDLVKNAVDRNIGRSDLTLIQNRQAIDQNSKQATIAERGDKAADRETALKIQAQNALDRKEEKATQRQDNKVKGLEGRLDRIDKEIAENNKDLGDVAKKAGAAKNFDALNKKRTKIQADLDEALGLEPEKVDSKTAAGDITPQPNQPLPPRDQLKDGQVYDTPRGKAKWNGTEFVKI